MDVFQPSAIQPTLQIVDFTNSRERDIVGYLGLGSNDQNLWMAFGGVT